jgi:hypothetical protein
MYAFFRITHYGAMAVLTAIGASAAFLVIQNLRSGGELWDSLTAFLLLTALVLAWSYWNIWADNGYPRERALYYRRWVTVSYSLAAMGLALTIVIFPLALWRLTELRAGQSPDVEGHAVAAIVILGSVVLELALFAAECVRVAQRMKRRSD